MLSAARTLNIIVIDELLHLLMAPAVHGRLKLDVVCCGMIFDDLVGTESLMTFLTVKERIGKTSEMSRCHPCLGIHEYRTVHAYIIRAFLHELLPPCTLYVVFKLNSEITVIPCVCKSAVYL